MAHIDRRTFLRALATLSVATPVALLAPRRAAAADECSLEGRDLDPHKGFASTRPGSGGQCTTYAARRFDQLAPEPGVNWSGNAGTWAGHAASAGWLVVDDLHAARPGAVVVWSGGTGHVAYVERVTDEGIEVAEMNWSQQMCGWSTRFRTSAWGRVDRTVLSWDEVHTRLWHPFVGYIYPVRLEP